MIMILAIFCSQALAAPAPVAPAVAPDPDQPVAISSSISLSLSRLLEQFDANHDGKLSAEERAAFTPLLAAAANLYDQQPKDDATSGIRPSAAKIFAQTDKLLPLFDKNNDGILDEKEKEKAEFSASVVQRWCPDFDNNYDGQLDNDEQTRMAKAWNDYLDMLTRNAVTQEDPAKGHQSTPVSPIPGSGLVVAPGKTDPSAPAVAGTGNATTAAIAPDTGTAGGKPALPNKSMAGAGQGSGGNKSMAGAGQGSGGNKSMAGAGQGRGGNKSMAGAGQGSAGKPMGGRPGRGAGGNSSGAGQAGKVSDATLKMAKKEAQQQAQANQEIRRQQGPVKHTKTADQGQ